MIAVVLTSLLKVAFSARLFQGIFLGQEPASVAKHFHVPPSWMLMPPAVLAACALVLGVAPELLSGPIHHLHVPGLHTPTPPELHLWHGVTRELLASMAVVAAGFGVVAWGNRTAWRWAVVPRWLQFDLFYDRGVEALGRFAKVVTRVSGADWPGAWPRVPIAALVVLVGGFLWMRFPPGEVLELLGDGLSDQRWDGLRVLGRGVDRAGGVGRGGVAHVAGPGGGVVRVGLHDDGLFRPLPGSGPGTDADSGGDGVPGVDRDVVGSVSAFGAGR